MEEKKSLFDSIRWAKYCVILMSIEMAIFLFLSFLLLLEFNFEIISNFRWLECLAQLLIFIFHVIPFAMIVVGLFSCVRLIITSRNVKKAFIQSSSSIFLGVIILIGLGYLHSYSQRQKAIGYPKVICNTHLRTLAMAYSIYVYDNQIEPTANRWCDLFNEECDVAIKQFQCLVDKTGPCSYAMNENIPADAKELPGDLVLLFESAPGWNQTGGVDDVVTDRHGKPGATIAFADGTVKFVKAEDIGNLRWTMEE